jgi:hypothetical protein
MSLFNTLETIQFNTDSISTISYAAFKEYQNYSIVNCLLINTTASCFLHWRRPEFMRRMSYKYVNFSEYYLLRYIVNRYYCPLDYNRFINSNNPWKIFYEEFSINFIIGGIIGHAELLAARMRKTNHILDNTEVLGQMQKTTFIFKNMIPAIYLRGMQIGGGWSLYFSLTRCIHTENKYEKYLKYACISLMSNTFAFLLSAPALLYYYTPKNYIPPYFEVNVKDIFPLLKHWIQTKDVFIIKEARRSCELIILNSLYLVFMDQVYLI